MNRGTLPNVGIDAWTYGPLAARAVAASGTPTDPIFDTVGDPRYNWVRYNTDLDGFVTAQYQIQTVGTFSEGSGADAWCFRLPVPARRPNTTRGEWPLGTALAYRSFTAPFVNIACTPVLADPAWPQLRADPDSWFQVAVPYCWQVGTGTITGVASPDTLTVSHALGYAPKAYDISLMATESIPIGSAATGFWRVMNIDTDSFDAVINVTDGDALDFAWKIMAEPQTGNPWLGPRKPFHWSSSTTHNLFAQLRYEAA